MIDAPPRDRTKPRTTEKVETRYTVSEGPSGEAYARFMELPPALVMAVLWLAGVALLALCGFALYLVVMMVVMMALA